MGRVAAFSAGVTMLALAVAGCAQGHPVPELEGGIELGLRRGGEWSTLTVRPPWVIGPRVSLKLANKAFTGNIDGRAVSFVVEKDGIRGTGPTGSVSIDIIDAGPDQVTIEGFWNGSRAHFNIGPQDLKGSLAVYRPATFGRESSMDRPVDPRSSRLFHCQYVLDRVEKDGSRAGTSTCDGMPEDTVLEIPRAVQGWLTRSEMAVIVLSLLSSPPLSSSDINGL
jgi:hypothetical protein